MMSTKECESNSERANTKELKWNEMKEQLARPTSARTSNIQIHNLASYRRSWPCHGMSFSSCRDARPPSAGHSLRRSRSSLATRVRLDFVFGTGSRSLRRHGMPMYALANASEDELARNMVSGKETVRTLLDLRRIQVRFEVRPMSLYSWISREDGHACGAFSWLAGCEISAMAASASVSWNLRSVLSTIIHG